MSNDPQWCGCTESTVNAYAYLTIHTDYCSYGFWWERGIITFYFNVIRQSCATGEYRIRIVFALHLESCNNINNYCEISDEIITRKINGLLSDFPKKKKIIWKMRFPLNAENSPCVFFYIIKVSNRTIRPRSSLNNIPLYLCPYYIAARGCFRETAIRVRN